MPKETFENLLNGKYEIVDSYKKVKHLWEILLAEFDWDDENCLEKMSRIVGDKQLDFEHLVNNKSLGQELLVVVGVAQFYSSSDGFGQDFEKAKLVIDGILSSYCSMEVKFVAEEVAELYRLNNFEDNFFE